MWASPLNLFVSGREQHTSKPQYNSDKKPQEINILKQSTGFCFHLAPLLSLSVSLQMLVYTRPSS